MEVPSSSNQKGRNRVPKPSWADMVEGKHKDVDKEKEAPKTKDEPMEEKEEEEWWTKDWKSSSMSWNDWWQKKEDEWQEWQAWKRWEEEQEEEDAKEKDAKLAATKTEEEKEEKSVLQGKGARWTNRPGSQKEKGRMKWAQHKAKEEGYDEDLVKLGALGSSRVKRLLSRQQDRMSQKETVEAAKEAAREAAQAAQSAQAVVWQQYGYQWGQASQAYQWPQAYQWQWGYYPAYWDPSQGQSFFFGQEL